MLINLYSNQTVPYMNSSKYCTGWQRVYLSLEIVSIMLILRHVVEPFHWTKSYWIYQAWLKVLLQMLGKSRCDLRFVEYTESISSNYVFNSWLFLMLLWKKLYTAQQALSVPSQFPLKRYLAKKKNPQHGCMLSIYYFFSGTDSQL